MTLNSLLTTFQKLIDVSIVWILVYAILKNLKNNIKMVMLLKGTLIILIIKLTKYGKNEFMDSIVPPPQVT